MDALLRAVPRGRAPPRRRLRARGEHLAREPRVGRAARLLARRSRRGEPAGGPVRGQDPRARGGPGPADRAQRADRARGRRLRPREPHDGRRGGGVPLVAGRRSRGHGRRHRRPRSRSRTSRRRSASSGRRRSTVSRSRCPSPSRPTGGSRPVSPLPRRSSRSTPRRTARRRTSWSTAPTRPTSCPCSTGRGRGTACSASGRTRRRRATPSSTSPRCSTTAIRSELAEEYLAIGERLPHLTVLGGCCGTDHRHVGSVADAWFGAASPPSGCYGCAASRSPTRTCSVSSVRKRAGSPAT